MDHLSYMTGFYSFICPKFYNLTTSDDSFHDFCFYVWYLINLQLLPKFLFLWLKFYNLLTSIFFIFMSENLHLWTTFDDIFCSCLYSLTCCLIMMLICLLVVSVNCEESNNSYKFVKEKNFVSLNYYVWSVFIESMYWLTEFYKYLLHVM